jgi:hypothetical protein
VFGPFPDPTAPNVVAVAEAPAARRVEYMDLDEIMPATRNPKRHDRAGIHRSISYFGLAEVPLIDERTGRLVAGHGRIADLRERIDAGQSPPDGVDVTPDGRWLVPVIRGWASRSDEDAEAYLLASNNLTLRGGWNAAMLADVLADLATIPGLPDLTGFDEDARERIADAQRLPGLDAFKSFDDLDDGAAPTSASVVCPGCGYEFVPGVDDPAEAAFAE